MGKIDITKHSQTKSHIDIAKTKINQSKLDFTCTDASSQLSMQCNESKLKWQYLLLVQIYLMTVYHLLSELDSKVASVYHSARTKATSILNIAVAPHLISVLVKHMKCHAFSLAIDGILMIVSYERRTLLLCKFTTTV